MGKSRAKRRAARKARRSEPRPARVKPSALAEAKKRPWIMQELLRLGRADGGIDADQFEAGLEVVEASRALTHALGYRSQVALDRQLDVLVQTELDWTPAEARLISIYLAWGCELTARAIPTTAREVARAVEAEGPVPKVPVLRRALDLWDRVRTDWDRGRAQLRGNGPFDKAIAI